VVPILADQHPHRAGGGLKIETTTLCARRLVSRIATHGRHGGLPWLAPARLWPSWCTGHRALPST